MRSIFTAIAVAGALTAAPALAFDEGAKAATTMAADPDQKMKCRKVEKTGSLVTKGKVCKTVAEWKRIIDNGNRTARAVVEEGAKPTN